MSKNHNLEYYPEEKILNPPAHAKYEVDLILSYLKKDKKPQIVDFGSGGGRLTIPLLQNGYKVLAIDTDEKSQEQLLKTATKIKKNKDLQIEATIPTDKKFNYILGADILHHLEMNKYLKIFFDHLNNKGTIIFSEPNILNIGWLIFISLFLDWKQEKGIGQINFFNLQNQLKFAGFKKVNIIGLFLFPPILFNKIKLFSRLNLFLGNFLLLKLFAFRYVIFAEK